MNDYKECRKLLIKLRRLARPLLAHKNTLVDDLNLYTRQKKKLNIAGISIPVMDISIKNTEEAIEQIDESIYWLGESICNTLDLWQHTGATLKDLCNLINLPYRKALEEIKKEEISNTPFSELFMIYNLDYLHHEKDEWYDTRHDGPYSHCIREYEMTQFRNRPREAKEEIHEYFVDWIEQEGSA